VFLAHKLETYWHTTDVTSCFFFELIFLTFDHARILFDCERGENVAVILLLGALFQ